MNILPDDFVQALLEEMEQAGQAHALAKARLKGLEEGRKIQKAQLMKVAEATGLTSMTRQESFAYAHPQYKLTVDQLVAAVQDEADKHYAYKLIEVRWESWRTLNANERAAQRG